MVIVKRRKRLQEMFWPNYIESMVYCWGSKIKTKKKSFKKKKSKNEKTSTIKIRNLRMGKTGMKRGLKENEDPISPHESATAKHSRPSPSHRAFQSDVRQSKGLIRSKRLSLNPPAHKLFSENVVNAFYYIFDISSSPTLILARD